MAAGYENMFVILFIRAFIQDFTAKCTFVDPARGYQKKKTIEVLGKNNGHY